MNGESGDCSTPVRRSSRARKPNSRFAEDELDGCIKKIVVGVSASEVAGSGSGTPSRQRKPGKKRESECEDLEESPQSSKEPGNIVSTLPQTQNKTDDSINGVGNEKETHSDIMGRLKSSPEKPQERRTRSNARKDTLEILPKEEKKRSRKAAKGKIKGGEEKEVKECLELEETKSESVSEIPVDKDGACAESSKAAEFGETSSLKDPPRLESSNESQGSVEDDLSLQSPSKDRQKGKHVKKLDLVADAEKEYEVQDKGTKFALKSRVSESKYDEEFMDKESHGEPKLSPSRFKAYDEAVEPRIGHSESIGKQSTTGVKDDVAHENIKSDEGGMQHLLVSSGEKEEGYGGALINIRDKEGSPQKEFLVSPSVHETKVDHLSSRDRAIHEESSEVNPSQGKVDFSEAETSTPSRGRRDSTGKNVCTPQRRSTRSVSSENEASGSKSRPDDEMEVSAGMVDNKTTSPVKRRGRSAKLPSKGSGKTVHEELLSVEVLNIPENTRTKTKNISGSSLTPSIQDSPDKLKTEKMVSDMNPLPQNFQEIKNTCEGSVEIEMKVGISEEVEGDSKKEPKEGFVSKGKRNRSERNSETEDIGSLEKVPKEKRKKDLPECALDSSQEEDLKRKRQDEPSEDQITKKRKKSNDDNSCDIPSDDNHGSENRTIWDCRDTVAQKEFEGVAKPDMMMKGESSSTPVASKVMKDENKSGESKSGSEGSLKIGQNEPVNVQPMPDVQERRQSSVGSILSLLKRPDSKKIESTSSSGKSYKTDLKFSESKRQDDRKWRRDDHESASLDAKNQDERIWKAAVEKFEAKMDDDISSRERHASGHDGDQRNASEGSTSKFADISEKEGDGLDRNMTWDSMKEMAPFMPSTFSNKKRKVTKSTVETDSFPKTLESQIKETDDEKKIVEERRHSSIGNILSFLKRGGQSNVQPKQDDLQSKAEDKTNSVSNESKIFSFVESSRKSSFPRDESYNSYGNQESNPPQSKSVPKTRERRVSRWSAREDTTEASGSHWDNVQSYQSSSGLPSQSSSSRNTNWNEKPIVGAPSFSKWENLPSERKPAIAVRSESDDGARVSDKTIANKPYGTWNEERPSWKSWGHNQERQGEFESSNKMYESECSEDKFRDSDKESKDSTSDDENLDFGNREGISEFIESYADELDQSGEDVVPSNSQPHTFHREIQAPSQNRDSTWSSKKERERSLSPNREMFTLPSEKELSSPPRERVWSPRSSEIVLSPKSRELMSSLMNMEVKLTPQMQELMSLQNKPDSVPSQDVLRYPGKHDVISIPLPGDSDLPTGRKERTGVSAFIESEYSSKCPENNQQIMSAVRGASPQEGNRTSSLESSWRNPPNRHDRPCGGRYDVKNEHFKALESVKDEDDEDEQFEVRNSRIEAIHEDKENLEPKLEERDFSEVEKHEYQRKIQRDIEVKEERNRIVVDQRMKLFNHIKENLYLSDRKKSKRSKEVRRMVCDCSLTKEEIARGEVGCGEDCLNRLLMIECGSRCPLKECCTNKRFQNFVYADVEVFNAGDKGCGIRARKTIPAGTFIMEYVGEVFDAREFKRRRKEYSRNHSAHFYFMALKGDLFIDATRKGNISRFINHSCDPNAQTQKWTVNGELRVGFFAQKMIEAGEEINFDYRLERYGREPQKCYCGTATCRGWLGESPDEKTKEEKEEERRQERDRRKREEKRSYVEDVDLEDEIEKLNAKKLRTRQDILNLCRLMVRADNSNSRVMLLRLVQSSTSACKRLFMDYHGLSLLWSWMADLGYAYEHASIKIEILKTLECLPITNKTQLTDSRVLGVVERWSTQSVEIPVSGSPPPPPPPRAVGCGLGNVDSDSGKKSSDTSEDSDGEMDSKPVSAGIDSSSVDDISMDSADVEQEALKGKPSLEGCLAEDDSSDSNLSDEKKSAVEPGEGDTAAAATPQDEAVSRELLILHGSMVELAIKLLEQWKDLKEYFRIPKKERIELMKEHEREVEEEIRGLDKDRKEKDNFSSPSRYRRDFDRRRRSPDREKEKDRYSRRSSRGDRDSREDRSSDSPKMSKEQRRQLFEIQVQQEEEAKQRKMQEEMWAMHVDRCRLLGQDPYLTPIFDPTCQFYWDPNTASWQPYNGTEPNIPVPAAYGYRPSESGDGSPMIVGMPPGHVIASQTVAGHLAPDSEAATPNYDDPRIDPATIPLPGEVRQTSPTQPLPCQAVPVEGTPPQGARVLTFPVPAETAGVAMTPAATMPVNIGPSALAVPFVVGEEPPPPPPGPITIQLPPRWKMARDSEGHVYFYHVKSRTSQWEPPTLEQHQKLEAEMGSESDSNDSSSSDSDSTSTTDSEDFSSDEEEEEEVVKVTTVEIGELCDEKMIRRHRAKKPRSEALVQERVISTPRITPSLKMFNYHGDNRPCQRPSFTSNQPVLEMDKEAARRERREAKERAQKEVRQERQDDRLLDSGVDVLDPNEEIEPLSEKIQRLERSEAAMEKDRHEYREKVKIREKTKSKERAATAIADNSDSARKCKENFRAKMATYIVSVLNPYRRDDCKIGRITCNEDFKYLARKLTHFVMIKELKQLHSVEDLECNDSVKYKTKDFVRKYMSKYGHEFKRDPTDTKEY
ncbi:histone-lysine N-methyltransferase SETD2 isoform X2 [Palaemon carinicauda]|uniref:histone-lysine N-methyltransferase SETD2 isoform X2 n=1 Tax=Palaemon carinicauda TaxID=392227 RepID=UPI0035B5AD09